jgi:membrane protease YdiL (CAAX protease family)
MNDRPNPTTRSRGATWVGFFIALFGILIVRAAVYAFYPPYSFPAAAWRESLNWVCAIALLLIIRFGERLPFRSVGIGRATIKSSLAWGGIIAVVCAVLAFGIVALTHYNRRFIGRGLREAPALANYPDRSARRRARRTVSTVATPLNAWKRSV